MGRVEDLKKELEALRKQKNEKAEVKKLKRQIKAEKFAQTKTGKVFNAVGKVFTPSPQPTQKSKKKRKSVSDFSSDLDKILGGLPA